MTDEPVTTDGGVRHVEVDPAHAGQRIDNFLMAILKGVPRSLIYRLLRTGQVRVNKSRIRQGARLQAGDRVRIPPVKVTAPTPGHMGTQALAQLEAAILYEDADLLVLNKPSGVAVHSGSGVEAGVIEGLRQLRPEVAELSLAHRLDRETSGCLLAVKNRGLLPALNRLLAAGEIEKHYLALVKGIWKRGPATIEMGLSRNRLRSGERMVQVDAAGKRAVSQFIPRATYPVASLMEVRLDTGRTHQIRVHAAELGHPLAGDDKYGDRAFNRELRGLGLKRLFLHASRLAFRMPDGGRRIRVEAPLPEALQAVLDRLGPARRVRR